MVCHTTKQTGDPTFFFFLLLLLFVESVAASLTIIEGNFRETCNNINVMRVLRENKDSVMAVLEAFVYDPLLNWGLIDGGYIML